MGNVLCYLYKCEEGNKYQIRGQLDRNLRPWSPTLQSQKCVKTH